MWLYRKKKLYQRSLVREWREFFQTRSSKEQPAHGYFVIKSISATRFLCSKPLSLLLTLFQILILNSVTKAFQICLPGNRCLFVYLTCNQFTFGNANIILNIRFMEDSHLLLLHLTTWRLTSRNSASKWTDTVVQATQRSFHLPAGFALFFFVYPVLGKTT